MPKIFDRIFQGRYVPRRLNEDVWFERYQKILLWMANHPEGRKLLRLEQSSINGKIHRIRKNLVRHDEYVRDASSPTGWYRLSTTEFRTSAKYANLIRLQWDWFCALVAEYNAEMAQVGVRSPLGIGMVPGLAFTTTTVYPDPHPETTSCDGYIANVNATYATCRNAASGNSADATDGNGGYLAHEWRTVQSDYRIYRDVTLFDTSAIDDADTISDAVYSLNCSLVGGNDDSDSVSIVTCTPATNTDVITDDFDQFGTTKQATDIAFATIGSTDTYYDFTLNATGLGNISKTGISKFGFRTAKDIAATTPTGANQRNFYMADNTGTTKDPKLVITHGAAADVHGALALMGCGI